LTIAAIVAGAIGGLIGFVPLLLSRKSMPKSSHAAIDGAVGLGMVSKWLAMVVLSFAVMLIEIIFCRIFAKDYLIFFGVACILAFIVVTLFYVISLARQRD